MERHILFIISSLSAGGAERVITNLANGWAGKGRQASLITFDDGTMPPFYDLSPQVNHISLGILGVSRNPVEGFFSNLRRILALRKIIRTISPDIVVSFIDLTNVLVLAALWGTRIPILVAEHSDPAMTMIGPYWNRLRSWTYPRADRLVVLNHKAKSFFSNRIQKRTVIIPNPIVLTEKKNDGGTFFSGSVIMAMGRLSEEKRIENLLRAFALLKDQYPGWNLKILGDGPLREQLERLRDCLGLNHRVEFLGVIKDPHVLLRKADLFVLPSRFEGFPMALGEAMACGLPVISTEYHSGVRDLIDDGVNGILVPLEDISALASAMKRLMGDDRQRKRLGNNAKKIVQQFGLEKIMGMWEALFQQTAVEKRR